MFLTRWDLMPMLHCRYCSSPSPFLHHCQRGLPCQFISPPSQVLSISRYKNCVAVLQYSTSPTFPIAGTKEVRLVPPVSGSGDPSTQGLGFVLPDLLQDTFYYVRVGVANSGGMSPLTASFQIPSIGKSFVPWLSTRVALCPPPNNA